MYQVPSEKKKSTRSARLRSAIEFLTSIPLGTHPETFSPHSAGRVARMSSLPEDSVAHALDVPSSAAITPAGTGLVAEHLATPRTDKVAPIGNEVNHDTADITIRIRGKAFKHITSRGQRESTAFRQALLHDGVLDGRIIFARNKEYPSGMFSIIRYDAKVESALIRERLANATNMLLEPVADHNVPLHQRWKGRSYAASLHAEHAPCGEERDLVAEEVRDGDGTTGAQDGAILHGHPAKEAYNPMSLDDPTIDLEKQRRAYTREGYMFSLLSYRNERSQKDDINQKFYVMHPFLDFGDGQGITLSKIRSLKRTALEIWWRNGWEISTVAAAIVSFERLVFKRIINKSNRKLAMCCCLLLAYKMNEAREMDNVTVQDVLRELESRFDTTKKQILRAEFPVFVHLRFGLKFPACLSSSHLNRLLATKGTSANEYLGPDLFQEYSETLTFEAMHESDDDHHTPVKLRRRSSSTGHTSETSEVSSKRKHRRKRSKSKSSSVGTESKADNLSA